MRLVPKKCKMLKSMASNNLDLDQLALSVQAAIKIKNSLDDRLAEGQEIEDTTSVLPSDVLYNIIYNHINLYDMMLDNNYLKNTKFNKNYTLH